MDAKNYARGAIMFKTCGGDMYVPSKKFVDFALGTQVRPTSDRMYTVTYAKKLITNWLLGQCFTAIGEHGVVL